MLKTMEGIYRNDKIELLKDAHAAEEAHVFATFLPADNAIDLRTRGIDASQAADLRSRLQTFAEDWERPEMDAYDAL